MVLSRSYDKSQPILFFTPEAAVTPHLIVQAILAKTLQEQGYKPIFAHCPGGIFNRCPPKEMYSLPMNAHANAHAQVCGTCVSCSSRILGHYNLESINLAQFVTEELKQEVSNSMTNFQGHPRDFVYRNIPLGRLATIDFSLNTKKSKIATLTDADLDVMKLYLQSSLVSYLMARETIKKVAPGRVLYFNDYTLGTTCRIAAQELNVPVFFVSCLGHRVLNMSIPVILPTTYRLAIDQILDDWKSWEGLALTEPEIEEVAIDSLMRLGAKSPHVYSPAKTFAKQDLFSLLKLDPSKKLIVAYTSGVDEFVSTMMNREVFSGRGPGAQPFDPELGSMQVGWLRSIIEYVEARDDLRLVIRVHPREGSNHRDKTPSDHLETLMTEFLKHYRNCDVIWPGEKISSYDLGEIADLVLTAYSGMGMELSRLGVPILAAFKGVSVADTDFIEWAPTKEEYFKKLEQLLERKPTYGTVRNAFRGYAISTFSFGLNFDDVLPFHIDGATPEYKTPREAKTFEDIIINQRYIVDINKERRQAKQTGDIARREEVAIKRQLKRVLHFFFTGETESCDHTLVVIQDRAGAGKWDETKIKQLPEVLNGANVALVDGKNVTYFSNGKLNQRYSPLCARIATICAERPIQPEIQAREAAYGISAILG